MPIRTPGSADFEHFASIYQQISDVATALNFETVRADDVDRSGSISQDIILRLSGTDLVVADLSDQNPNVFYELGVRHVLRKRGTVLLIDEIRTPTIPFDLSSYRVIKYRGRLEGLSEMRASLTAAIKQSLDESAGADNPVHDWIPTLPVDVAALADGSEAGQLRSQIAELRATVADYQKRFGIDDDHSSPIARKSPLNVVQGLLRDAEAGNLPSDLLEKTRKASESNSAHDLLSALSLLIQTGATLSERQTLQVAQYAQNLGLEQAQLAALEYGLEINPGNNTLRAARIARLLHSTVPSIRAAARRESAEMIGVDEDTNRLPASVIASRSALQRVGPLLDSYHEDELDTEAYALTENWLAQAPDSTVLLRNHARAHERLGHKGEALDLYHRSIMVDDSDDTSVIWFANTLHNLGRHVDAIELYHLAALIDLDDGSHFAHLADELSIAIADPFMMGHDIDPRPLPENIPVSAIEWISAALSCRLVGVEVLQRCDSAARRINARSEPFEVTRQERLEMLRVSYSAFTSSLTSGAPALRRFQEGPASR